MPHIIDDDSEEVNPVRSVHAWRSMQYGNGPAMNILTHHTVYEIIIEQAQASLPNETGGFLLGCVGFDPNSCCWHVEIDEVVPIQPSDCDPTHFSYSWHDVDRVRSYREQARKALIGWYHTHPGLGIFLSKTDLEKTHTQLFNEPFQVALVYDPIGGRAGYFCWESPGALDPGAAEWREFELSKELRSSTEDKLSGEGEGKEP